jgi:hypothetical protein
MLNIAVIPPPVVGNAAVLRTIISVQVIMSVFLCIFCTKTSILYNKCVFLNILDVDNGKENCN